MMRRPTPDADLYAWYRAKMAGDDPDINPDDPQCGWYERRLVRGGPMVAAWIFVEREIDPETGELMGDERLACEVNGERRDPLEEWAWLCGRLITEAMYEYRMARRSWAGWYAPQLPEANPRRRIDFATLPPPDFGKD